MLLVALLAVALILLALFRGDRRRALVPLAPIVLATGWSALVLFAVRIPLNPMSVTLGALVIAISTEFSVLLSERYRQERLPDTRPRRHAPCLQHTGAAVAASGVTAIAGLRRIGLSDIAMLRDFGLVTLDRPVRLARRGARRAAGRRDARRKGGVAVGSRDGARRRPPWADPARRFHLHVALTSQSGAAGMRPGDRVPPFAAPFALGGPPGEVDVATHAHEGPLGRVPACSERGQKILNICELYERGPVVLALFFRAGSCAGILEDLQRLARSFPRVGFAAVAVREEAAPIARLVRSERLTVPVGVDPEGRLGGLYTMVSCPQITLVDPGGIVQSAPLLGRPPLATLRARVSELLAASLARGWRPGRA